MNSILAVTTPIQILSTNNLSPLRCQLWMTCSRTWVQNSWTVPSLSRSVIVPAALPAVKFAGNPASSSAIRTASSSPAVSTASSSPDFGTPEQVFLAYEKARSEWYLRQPPRSRNDRAYRKEHSLPLTYRKGKYQWAVGWKEMKQYCTVLALSVRGGCVKYHLLRAFSYDKNTCSGVPKSGVLE
ncbi:hypothetical protein E4U32_007526 [Claviceps aff. humidiphila group G2b]|nr:hypothetical protein E4U32_007526 [Claviceps aff. humidiphila group G2b]